MKAGEMTDILLGRVVKAFGIRGELKLDPAADFWEGALRSRNLVLRRRTDAGLEERGLVVAHYRPQGACYIVRLAGVEDRNHAEELVGSELLIDESTIDVALPDVNLPFQVLGARVRSVEGEVLGEVTAVLFSPAHDVYEVTGKKGTFMVPAVAEFVTEIDDEKREIVIRTIPGLIGEGDDE